MRRLSPAALAAAALLALAAAPSAAQARWSAPRPLPSVTPYASSLLGAVDDHGHTVVTYTGATGTRLLRLRASGGAPGRPVAVTGIDDTETLALLAGGTVVGVGSREVIPTSPSPLPDCCEEAVVFRQPALGGAVATQEQPAALPEGNWGSVATAIAPDGTVSLLASLDDGLTGDSPNHYAAESARAGDPAIVLAGTPFLTTQWAATGARALSDGRAAIAWRGNREIHVLALRDGAAVGTRAFRTPPVYDESLVVTGSGRVVRVGGSGGRFWLWSEARGRHLLARTGVGADNSWLVGGPHGTAAVAFIDGDRVRLATLDRRGRFHGPVTLGRRPSTALPSMPPLPAIDARGGVHVAWATRGGGVVIHGPHRTHHIPTRHTAEIADLTVSPSGADLVLWRVGAHAFAARSSP
ncbi:hypothetical protein [Conexibacter woesei]|uniref:hypothetical protein n=1 Tax=Conexibacter woesei TaxID=191495 RepID=UPI000408B5CB|nr:hypothetical protein [Conexibacter woesei]